MSKIGKILGLMSILIITSNRTQSFKCSRPVGRTTFLWMGSTQSKHRNKSLMHVVCSFFFCHCFAFAITVTSLAFTVLMTFFYSKTTYNYIIFASGSQSVVPRPEASWNLLKMQILEPYLIRNSGVRTLDLHKILMRAQVENLCSAPSLKYVHLPLFFELPNDFKEFCLIFPQYLRHMKL